jgi:hypothetical protein
MKTVILIIVLCFGVCSALGQKSSDPAYKIRAQKGGVTVTFQKKAHWLKLVEQIDAAKITDTELLFASQKDGFRFLVIDVSGWSREKQNDRQCGAGVESNLIWVKLDSAWKILDAKSVNYESCWSGAELNEPRKLTKKSLNAEFDDFGTGLNVKLAYNADEPEKGFQITEKKIKEN